jgi:hypothetical protein
MVGVRFGDTSHISDILINGEVVDYITGKSYFKDSHNKIFPISAATGEGFYYDFYYPPGSPRQT